LIIGNSLKAGISTSPKSIYKAQRLIVYAGFVAFDAYKNMLADAEGKVSGPATVIAGFGAGATESLLAVTPFESIKTQL
jgi:solute carrier family 25 citrate transporter 1